MVRCSYDGKRVGGEVDGRLNRINPERVETPHSEVYRGLRRENESVLREYKGSDYQVKGISGRG